MLSLQAATSLERGDATCLSCRGTGALACSACKVKPIFLFCVRGMFLTSTSPLGPSLRTLQSAQGNGVMQQKVRMNQLRHTMNR